MDPNRLEALGQVVAEADAMGGPTPEQQEQEQKEADSEAQAREWGVIAFTIGGALSMFAPELRQVYTEQACLNWGRSVVPVAEKYGWSGVSKFPEFALLMATVGLAMPTFFVMRKRLTEDAGKGEGGGPLAGLKAWWRDLRARKAAKVGQQMAEVPQHGGAS